VALAHAIRLYHPFRIMIPQLAQVFVGGMWADHLCLVDLSFLFSADPLN
jgi:hypothetical protein